jgi:hypothetical protein
MTEKKLGDMICDFCPRKLSQDYVNIIVEKRDFSNRHKVVGTYVKYKLHQSCWNELERVILTKVVDHKNEDRK